MFSKFLRGGPREVGREALEVPRAELATQADAHAIPQDDAVAIGQDPPVAATPGGSAWTPPGVDRDWTCDAQGIHDGISETLGGADESEYVGGPNLAGPRRRETSLPKAQRAGRALRKPVDAQVATAGSETRPGYTAEQRLLLLDTWSRSGLPAGDFASLVGLSKHTLYAWKKRFVEEGPGGLVDQTRGAKQGSKLPELTRRTILMLKTSHPDWGCQRISKPPSRVLQRTSDIGRVSTAGFFRRPLVVWINSLSKPWCGRSVW